MGAGVSALIAGRVRIHRHGLLLNGGVATIQENARLTARSALLEATLDHMNLGLMIVDAAGKPLLVRATNLGNWLVPEGYMWLFQGGPQSPSEIRALVLELAGAF